MLKTIAVEKLNSNHLQALQKLQGRAHEEDKNTIPLYEHLLTQKRSLPCLLMFSKSELIGFLSVYFFYEEAVEVALVVDPSFRRQSIATTLLIQILPFIPRKINTLIFSTSKEPLGAWFKQHHFQSLHSDHTLTRENTTPAPCENQRLNLRPATHADIFNLSQIDTACFPENPAHMASRFESLLTDPDYQILLATFNHQAIGKVHLHFQKDWIVLSDMAILPAFQNQGFGRELLIACLNTTQSNPQKNIRLDVEAKNQQALRLYEGLGFQSHHVCHYWQQSKSILNEIFPRSQTKNPDKLV